MSKVVWKFPIPMYNERGMADAAPVIGMPLGAKILTLQLQDERPFLWAAVDPSQPSERRRFAIVGTGHAVPEDARSYVGTWQSSVYVFHLFERHEVRPGYGFNPDSVEPFDSWREAAESLRTAPASAGASAERGSFSLSLASSAWGPRRGTIRMGES